MHDSTTSRTTARWLQLGINDIAWEMLANLRRHWPAAEFSTLAGGESVTLTAARPVLYDSAPRPHTRIAVGSSLAPPTRAHVALPPLSDRLARVVSHLTEGAVYRIPRQTEDPHAPAVPEVLGPDSFAAGRFAWLQHVDATDGTPPFWVFTTAGEPVEWHGRRFAEAKTPPADQDWPWSIWVHPPDDPSRLALVGCLLSLYPLTIDDEARRAYYPMSLQLLVSDLSPGDKWAPHVKDWSEETRAGLWPGLMSAMTPDQHWQQLTEIRQELALLTAADDAATATRGHIAIEVITQNENRAPSADEQAEIAREMRLELARLADRIAFDPDAWERDGMFYMDALAVDAVEAIGDSITAEEMRTSARTAWNDFTADTLSVPGTPEATADQLRAHLWKWWRSPVPLKWSRLSIARLIAWTVWDRRVRQTLERKQTPALSMVFLDQLQRATIERERQHRLSADGAHVDLLHRGSLVAELHPDTEKQPAHALIEASLLNEFLSRMNNLTGHRLLRYIVGETHRMGISSDPRMAPSIVVEGGYQELAARLGMKGRKAAVSVREAIEAFQALRVKLPHGEALGLLWLHHDTAASRRARERIIINPAPMLRPGYVFSLPKHANRNLVPVPLSLPPLDGVHQHHQGAAVTLQLILGSELRLHALELAERGYIEITPATWRDLCRRVELPESTMARLHERWTREPDAVLSPVPGGPHRYAPGSAWGAGRKMFYEAGDKAAAGKSLRAAAEPAITPAPRARRGRRARRP